jgi:hypothetical protein
MPLVEQELLTRQEHVFLCYPLFSFLYSDLWIIVCPFARFLLTIALSFLRFTGSDYPSRFLLTIALSFLRFTGSDCPIGIFKLFFEANQHQFP